MSTMEQAEPIAPTQPEPPDLEAAIEELMDAKTQSPVPGAGVDDCDTQTVEDLATADVQQNRSRNDQMPETERNSSEISQSDLHALDSQAFCTPPWPDHISSGSRMNGGSNSEDRRSPSPVLSRPGNIHPAEMTELDK